MFGKFENPVENVDQERLKYQKNMWKIFGRQTETGKLLYKLYKSHQPIKINYPKPKQKTQQQLQKQKIKQVKECPQMTKIQYPQIQKRKQFKINLIDLIPKKKNFQTIQQEIQNYYKRVEIPVNNGKDRNKMKADLQQKFTKQKGILPKGAQLPQVSQFQFNQQQIQQRAMMKMPKKFRKYITSDTKKQVKQQPDKITQLNALFDTIMKEIQERQEFLQEIDHLKQDELKNQIKKQIVQRVSQLQKITQLKQQFKQAKK